MRSITIIRLLLKSITEDYSSGELPRIIILSIPRSITEHYDVRVLLRSITEALPNGPTKRTLEQWFHVIPLINVNLYIYTKGQSC